MKQAIAQTQPWISTTAKVIGTESYIAVKINIMNNSISKSYLILEEVYKKTYAFIPISGEISLSFDIGKIKLEFIKYDGISINLAFDDLLQQELIVSHFEKASLLFNDDSDQFRKENQAFLYSICSKNQIANCLIFSSKKELSSILSPVVLSETAKAMWESSVFHNNFSFFATKETARLSFLTWNVAGNHPTKETKSEFERVFSGPVVSSDLVYIAIEELEMSVKSVVTGSSGFSDSWAELIKSAPLIGENPDYELSFVENVGTLFVAVLVKKSMSDIIKIGTPQIIKFGAGGLLANKAAILLPVTLGEAKVNIASCHLSAGAQDVEVRNQQVLEILNSVGDNVDYLFLVGDLNYRINLSYEEALDFIKRQNITALLEYDQLGIERRKGKKLGELFEPEIRFLPTYKFDPNSDVYDTSAKRRVPSYTDRILIRSGKKTTFITNDPNPVFETDAFKHFMKEDSFFKTDINSSFGTCAPNYPSPPSCICYRSLKSKFSDHRPVHAIYKLTYPLVNKDKVNELHSITNDKYDELVELSISSLTVEPHFIVHSQNTENYCVTVTNKSLVWCHWSISKAHGHLIVAPAAGSLIAGESISIHISVGDDLIPEESFFILKLNGGGETKIQFVSNETEVPKDENIAKVKANALDERNKYKSLPLQESISCSQLTDSIISSLSPISISDYIETDEAMNDEDK